MSTVKGRGDSFPLQIAIVAVAVAIAGAAAAFELTIFRHGLGGSLGTLGTVLLVAGGTLAALLTIRSVPNLSPEHARAWTWLLFASLVYFALASLIAEPLYESGTFALGAPRTVTAQRQIDRAQADIERIAKGRAPSGYTEDQRWSIAVDRSEIKSAQADLVYARAVKDNEQVYPQYPVGGEPAPYLQHLRRLVDWAKAHRQAQGYPVYEPLPAYLLAPSAYAARIAAARSQAAGAKAQIALCASGSAAGYRGISAPEAIKGCQDDWLHEAQQHEASAASDQKLLDFERKALASVAP
ncbi:MAG: hypothetical protein WAJ85_04095 [Candidatus Baltobacteraceae bacterium]|jgi:hypothetical protein